MTLSPSEEFKLGMLTERGVRSLELIADALQTLAKVESERLSREYPPGKVPRATQVNRASDEKRDQYKDAPSESWMRETEAALPKSRFETKFEEDQRAKEAPKA